MEKALLCFPSQSFPAVYKWYAISAQQIKPGNYTYRDSEAKYKTAICFRSVQDLNSGSPAMEMEHYTLFSFHKPILISREYSGTHKHCQVLVLMVLFSFQTQTDTHTWHARSSLAEQQHEAHSLSFAARWAALLKSTSILRNNWKAMRKSHRVLRHDVLQMKYTNILPLLTSQLHIVLKWNHVLNWCTLTCTNRPQPPAPFLQRAGQGRP